jgi:hypothetical protein
MVANEWIVDVATNLFKRGGFCDVTPVDGTEALVVLPDETMPDVVNERYDVTSPTRRRQATSQEIAAASATALDASAISRIDSDKGIKAAVITSLWGRLGRQPTSAEITAERTRFIGIYKAL